MPRWNNSLEDNCKHILDNGIKNLHPNMYQTIISDVVAANLENNKKIIELYIRSKLGATSTISKKSKHYWLIRGWSEDEAHVKSKEHKQKNAKSVYSREFWLERTNPITGVNYTIDEADFERNSRRPIRKEYWIQKGYSEVESQQLAIDAKTSNNKLGAKSSATTNVRKVTSKRCVEYYTARGYSEDDAKELVSEGQRYFSKDICIKNYGEENGLKIWQDRQDRWQYTLNSKSEEEKLRINKLKLFKGGSISKGELQLFEELVNCGINCKKQHTILKNSTHHYVYDIIYKNKIIEYNGDYWHASPKKYKETDIIKFPNKSIPVNEIWIKDNEKIKFAESQGYEVLVVWESDFKQNKEQVIKECIQFLTQ